MQNALGETLGNAGKTSGEENHHSEFLGSEFGGPEQYLLATKHETRVCNNSCHRNYVDVRKAASNIFCKLDVCVCANECAGMCVCKLCTCVCVCQSTYLCAKWTDIYVHL